MENGKSTCVTKKQAVFHRVVAVISQFVGGILLVGMIGVAMNGSGSTDWSGAILFVPVCIYLFLVGRKAYRAYTDGEATEKSAVRVVRWLNLLSFLLLLAIVAFLIGNIIDDHLYMKLGFDF